MIKFKFFSFISLISAAIVSSLEFVLTIATLILFGSVVGALALVFLFLVAVYGILIYSLKSAFERFDDVYYSVLYRLNIKK
jgi:hypothetical protein